MKKIALTLFFTLTLISGCSSGEIRKREMSSNEETLLKNRMNDVHDYYAFILSEFNGTGNIPTSYSDGGYKATEPSGWTSGFFPGILWVLYENSGDELFKKQAGHFTQLLENEQYNTGTHDLGFMMYCSYGHAYRITKDESYKNVLINSAVSLSKRFSPVVGCIKSWDFPGWWKEYPVIIDNMMNLELLMWAGKNDQNPSLSEIAINHATKTMENQYMDDYSSYHVVDYDTINGGVLKKGTFQGAHDTSSWSRGQGWGLYGFTMMYRETGKKQFLEQAENIAAYILPQLDENYMACWDFSLRDDENEERDASAAAIIASALVELYELTGKKQYFNTAKNIILTLSSPEYFNTETENGGFLLKHSVVSKPAGIGLNIPLVYADYYYVEAITRLLKLLA